MIPQIFSTIPNLSIPIYKDVLGTYDAVPVIMTDAIFSRTYSAPRTGQQQYSADFSAIICLNFCNERSHMIQN